MNRQNFKGWMYTIMRNIFINNYRKVVRDQTFIDRTDNLYHLNFPQQQQMVLKVFGFYIIWRLLRGGFGAGVRRGERK